MNGPSELKVSAEAHGKVVKRTLFPVYGKQVCKSLGRMIMSAVTRIYNRHRSAACSHIRSAFLRVSHGYDVCVAAHRPCCVPHAFALGSGGALSLRKSEDITAKLHHGSLKAEPRPCGGLEEQCCQLLTPAFFTVFIRVVYYVAGNFDKFIYLLNGKVQYIDQASHYYSISLHCMFLG